MYYNKSLFLCSLILGRDSKQLTFLNVMMQQSRNVQKGVGFVLLEQILCESQGICRIISVRLNPVYLQPLVLYMCMSMWRKYVPSFPHPSSPPKAALSA